MRRFTPLAHARAFPELQDFCTSTQRRFHSLSRVPQRKQRAERAAAERAAAGRGVMGEGYAQWSQQQLIARIRELEGQMGSREEGQMGSREGQHEGQASGKQSPRLQPKAFDANKYSTRLVALKFAYLGQKYNGFEHHNNNKTPLPTIEEELWKALVKTRLITPTPREGRAAAHDINWDGCEYSKCGRTDRGVSAFGQVIGVRVRSSRPQRQPGADHPDDDPDDHPDHPDHPELPYIQLLNRVLPPDIRIYAWCPNPPADFSARFSCKERRYKYFFTNPCFAPVPTTDASPTATATPMRQGWLDTKAMQDGCDRLVGLHDFRNFCKIDASKQLTNFKRRIFHASIDPVSPLAVPAFLRHPALADPDQPDQPTMYCFTLHGSAFLWHQVRSIVAVLFLLGQRLESPQLVTDLLDVARNPTRPKYEMASDAPLVLWDCIFPHADEVQSAEDRQHGYEDRLQWIYVGDASTDASGMASGKGKWGRGGVVDDVWEVWRANKMDETLSGLLLERIAGLGSSTLDADAVHHLASTVKSAPRVFDGGNVGRAKGNYVPVMARERQDPVDVVNERYARKRGLGTAP